jgi:uncharacterized repeat protein (TIGR02543 family)
MVGTNQTPGSGGGAIYNDGGAVTINNSTLYGNSFSNGAIYPVGVGRRGAFGGGIYNAGTLTMTNSTFFGNTAAAYDSYNEASGGGIFNSSNCTMKVISSTISGNSAVNANGSSYGAGVLNDGVALVENTIIARNYAGSNPDFGPGFLGTLSSLGFNLVGDPGQSTGWVASDLTGSPGAPLDPRLGPLQDNGGPTLTMTPLPDSAAVDSGNGGGLGTDQRQFTRPVIISGIVNGGDGSDIGACELQSSCASGSFFLSVKILGGGSVTQSPNQTCYVKNNTVSLTSAPDAGWAFAGWSGDASGTNNPLSVLMDTTKNITANFYQPTLSISVVGGGQVFKTPDQATYLPGSNVSVLAQPFPGWIFGGWSGNASGVGSPLLVSMDGNKHITANFTATGAACDVSPTNLIYWWPGSGNADELIHQYNGVPQNGATFAAGKVGQAFSFDGVDDQIALGNRPPIPTPWTVEFWVNRQDSPNNAALLLSDGDQSLRLEQYPFTRKVGFTKYGVADYVFNYSAPVGVWTHLAFVASATDTKLYANGVLQDTIAATVPLPLGTFGSQVKGLLDELSVYNRELSVQEIQSIYAAGAAGKCPSTCLPFPAGLVSFWPGAGNANDIFGTNDGILLNGATFTAGKVGGAFNLDGVDDYVSVPNAANLNPSSITIEAWIKCPSPVDYSRVVDKFDDATITGYGLGLHTNGTMRCDFGRGGGIYGTVQNPIVVNDGAWHHVAAVLTDNVQILYVDGVAGPNGAVPAVALATSQPLLIGLDPCCGGRYFRGGIDEVAIYNRALSASEIQTLYATGSAGKCVPPPYITSLIQTQNTANVFWLAQRGMPYLLQYKTNLNAPTWVNLLDMTATNSIANELDSNLGNAAQRFYRVQLLQ